MSWLEPGLLRGHTCLVTGATSGIGYETAWVLAWLGAEVALVGRSPERLRAAVERIRHQTGSEAVEGLRADLALMSQVRELAQAIRERLSRLHVLVNNAGVTLHRRVETAEGLEMTFALNHLAPFLLTNLLFDRLSASAPARIVNVSSGFHRYAKLNFDDLESRRRYIGFLVYARSKLANMLFTYELARRRNGSGVTVNAVHPGLVATRIARGPGAVFRWAKQLIDGVAGRTPVAGARPVVWLASAPELADVSGRYFSRLRCVPSSGASYDLGVARRLWDESARLVGLASPSSLLGDVPRCH